MSGFTGAPWAPSVQGRCPPVVAAVERGLRLGRRRLRCDRDHPDALLVAGLVLESHLARHGREHRVVMPEARALARLEGHPALPDDDRPRVDELAVAGLHAQPLADGIAAVLRARARLLVRHGYSSFFARVRVRGAASVVSAGPVPGASASGVSVSVSVSAA